MAIKLFINHDPELEWLIAVEYGRAIDGQPDDHFRYVGPRFRYLLDRPGGRKVGFQLISLRDFDPDEEHYNALWRPPRFDAPTLGLERATAGGVVLAAKAELADEFTTNRMFFNTALSSDGEDAIALWRHCLECGDVMAHYGLGYSLYELDRFREAYRHLRRYTEIVPTNAWAWCWLGKACAALDELMEARRAYETAMALEQSGGEETDAPELLAGLGSARA